MKKINKYNKKLHNLKKKNKNLKINWNKCYKKKINGKLNIKILRMK